MKKVMICISMIILSLFIITACAEVQVEPTSDEVLRDVEAMTANKLLGEASGIDEKIALTPIIIEEMDVSYVKGNRNETLNAEITAYIGNEKWRSEHKKTVVIQYALNSSNQWEAQGIKIDNPVIHLVPRE